MQKLICRKNNNNNMEKTDTIICLKKRNKD